MHVRTRGFRNANSGLVQSACEKATRKDEKHTTKHEKARAWHLRGQMHRLAKRTFLLCFLQISRLFFVSAAYIYLLLATAAEMLKHCCYGTLFVFLQLQKKVLPCILDFRQV